MKPKVFYYYCEILMCFCCILKWYIVCVGEREDYCYVTIVLTSINRPLCQYLLLLPMTSVNDIMCISNIIGVLLKAIIIMIQYEENEEMMKTMKTESNIIWRKWNMTINSNMTIGQNNNE